MNIGTRFLFLVIFCTLSYYVNCRNHEIRIKNDKRSSIMISQFGYYPRGYLFFNISKFSVSNNTSDMFGFTLDQSSNSGVSSYSESSNVCMLDKTDLNSHKLSAIVIRYLQMNKTFIIDKYKFGNGKDYDGVLFYTDPDTIPKYLNESQISGNVNFTVSKENLKSLKNTIDKYRIKNSEELLNYISKKLENQIVVSIFEKLALTNLLKASSKPISNPDLNSNLKILIQIMMRVTEKNNTNHDLLLQLKEKLQVRVTSKVSFPKPLLIIFPTSSEEGSYDLYFHNCIPNPSKFSKGRHPVNIRMKLVEKNWNSYLSAGDQPLPLLYFILCSAYVILTVIWTITLRTSEHMVYKIHYLMLTLLIMKAMTLIFHGINYYELGRNGVQDQGWAIMYYILHLLKGALLFTTIILIGAGWAFIKHMLSSKEKKIFLIIIPLQILANVAAIIIDESEESAVRYLTWRNIFLLVDLLCCGAILFPVIWSIKHLKEAANIDGKQQLNLYKLRLFRHFYILIICYIYFTRIIVYLLIITVGFKLTWTVDLFREAATFTFMIITGYKFRPVTNNPYLLVPNEGNELEEREELEHAWSQSGITEGVGKVNHHNMPNNCLEDTDEEDSENFTINYDRYAKLSKDSDQNELVHTSKL